MNPYDHNPFATDTTRDTRSEFDANLRLQAFDAAADRARAAAARGDDRDATAAKLAMFRASLLTLIED